MGQKYSYSFFIAGHTYGQPGVDNEGLHPPFVEKFEYLKNRTEIKFGILLGDIVSSSPVAQDWEEVDADISSLGLPVYFAVGNHDMENRPLFESRYGSTYYYFIYEDDLFIVLDPNIDEWNISGEQLEFLENTVSSNYANVQNIFVFFHQLLWWKNDNIYKKVNPNSFSGRADTINFWSSIEPLFHQLPNQVIMFAGDVGAAYWSSDFMYDTYDNITLIASGMGEEDGDNFIVVNVDTARKIKYDLICIDTPELYCFGELSGHELTNYENDHTFNIKVYPNPAREYITLEFVNPNESIVKVYNLSGHIVFETVSCTKSFLKIDLTFLPEGLYLIKTTTSFNETCTKLIVQ